MLDSRNVLEFQTKCKSKGEKDFEWTYRQGSTYHSGQPKIFGQYSVLDAGDMVRRSLFIEEQQFYTYGKQYSAATDDSL